MKASALRGYIFVPRIFLIDACSSLYNSASSLTKTDQGISTPLRRPLGTSLNPSGITVSRYGFPPILRFSRKGASDLVGTRLGVSKRYSCAGPGSL
jgi:hypothetical protein